MVEYRPKTHTQLQLPGGTVLSSLSTSFDLRIIYRCFPRNVAAIAQTLGLWEPGPYFSGPLLGQGTSSVQNRATILIKTFCWFRKPPERRKELHPFVQKGCGSRERWL
ncbi:hypothetical protein AVEN_214010-1 [Araneus ventricosus]|uniref:Uncharacterized protein n=1 Tax=Araneus ventricosus TaxID=182803 RepID=A0A4Y2KUB3_ARAVE|nr:hypothetical protein AVEN_214010-1 [Araneus ventricosus]